MDELVVTPRKHGLVLRRLKRSRTAPEVTSVIRRWYERRISRKVDVVSSAHLAVDWVYDASMRRHEAYFLWYEADLPAGYGRFVFDRNHSDRVRFPVHA